MSRRSLLAVPVLATAVGLCGCASASTRAVQSLPPVAALHKAQKVRADWLREIRTRARTAPAVRFDNPSRVLLRARLRRLEGRYGFRVVELRIYRPRQQAPLIVVETADKAALARNTHRILRVIDPKRRTSDDRTGWRYEGFYFEARDRAGVPFLAVFNFMRGRSAGGGQWASDDSLYPFPHG